MRPAEPCGTRTCCRVSVSGYSAPTMLKITRSVSLMRTLGGGGGGAGEGGSGAGAEGSGEAAGGGGRGFFALGGGGRGFFPPPPPVPALPPSPPVLSPFGAGVLAPPSWVLLPPLARAVSPVGAVSFAFAAAAWCACSANATRATSTITLRGEGILLASGSADERTAEWVSERRRRVGGLAPTSRPLLHREMTLRCSGDHRSQCELALNRACRVGWLAPSAAAYPPGPVSHQGCRVCLPAG